MRLAGMKRSTRVFGDRVIRSRKRFDESRCEHEAKKVKKVIPVDVVDIQENNVKVVGHCVGLVAKFEGNRRYNRCRKVRNFNEIDEGMGNIDKKERFLEKLDDNGTNGNMVIDGEKEEVIKLGVFKDVSLVNEYMSRVKRCENVYTRKRKSFDENRGSDKKYLQYYRKKKKVRVSLDTGSAGKDVTRKGPVVFASSSSSSSSVHHFSCFVSSVLRYLRKDKVFSRRRFFSFLLLEPAASIYQSNGTRLLLDSTFSKQNGFFKVFGSTKSIPFFTINFSSVPSCFLYMHSNLLLNFAFLSNAFSKLQIAENVTSNDIIVPAIDTTRSIYHLDKFMVVKKPRSAVKRIPRASGVKGYFPRKANVNYSSPRKAHANDSSSRKANVHDSSQRKAHVNDSSRRKAFVNSYPQRKSPARERVSWVSRVNNSSQRKTNAIKRVLRFSRVGKTSERKELVNSSFQRKVLIDESFVNKLREIVEGEVHVPVIKEVEGYEAVEYVPFFLPESYISSKSDEVTQTLKRSYPVYDMDSDDEKWLKKFNSKHFEVSDDIFEKAFGAFERGIHCSPNDYSDAASAIERCLDIASKGVLEGVYRYWMTKRKKQHSSRVRLGVFQCNNPHKVERVTRKTADRKKQSSSRLASNHSVEKQPVFKRAKLSDERVLEDTKRAYINVHEAQEAATKRAYPNVHEAQEAETKRAYIYVHEAQEAATKRAYTNVHEAQEAQEASTNVHEAQEAETQRACIYVHEAQEASTNVHEAQEASTNVHEAQEASTNVHEAQEAETKRAYIYVHEAQEASTNVHEAQEAETKRAYIQEASTNVHEAQEAATNVHEAQEAATNVHEAQEAATKRAYINVHEEQEAATKRAYINVHEAQEAARRSQEAAIAKRNEAQALMEIADLASYRATMALRIADALAAGGPVDNPAGDIFSFFC